LLGEDTDYNWTAGRSLDISAAIFTGSWDSAVIGNVPMKWSKHVVCGNCFT